MGCLYAIETDEYHGLYPDSKRCAREYGEGPDVRDTEDTEE